MANLDDMLYSEVENACANCGHRDVRALTLHHIDEAKPKNEAYDNKIVLCHNCHTCYHNGKGLSADDVKSIKQRLIMKTLTRQGLNAMKEAYRRRAVVAAPFLVSHLVELQFLNYRETVTNFAPDDSLLEHVDIAAVYELTPQGTALMEKWSLNAA